MCVSWRRRAASGVAAVGLLVAFTQAPAQAADAALPPAGRLVAAVQNTFTHRLHIAGWAYDPARPRAAVRVLIYVDGRFVARLRADHAAPRAAAALHVPGDHGYSITTAAPRRAGQVTVKTRGASTDAPLRTVATRSVRHYYPPPGDRIVYVARKYVGAPYAYGGASPAGFDCSGYTKYVYAQANVRTLVHSADGQRRSMRRITRSNARPGDLVFYMSGGSAYHVAVYAGHGWQYAAATPADGVRYQPIWSSAVRFGTDWH